DQTGIFTIPISTGSTAGCDSTVILDLTVNDNIVENIQEQICNGQTIFIDGNPFDQTGIFTIPISTGSTAGCDSTVILDLTVNDNIVENIQEQICNGQTIFIDGNPFDQTGIFTIPISTGSTVGCDSTVILDLTVSNEITNQLVETLCEGETLFVNGTGYNLNNPSGTEVIPNGSSGGCDSIIIVNLDFYTPLLGSISSTLPDICAGDASQLIFNLNGASTYTLSYSDGINTFTLTDITDGYSLTVNPSLSTTYTLETLIAADNPCPATFPSSSTSIAVKTIEATSNVLSDFNGYAVSCPDAQDGVAGVTGNNGQAPYTFSWSNGANNSIVDNLSAGVYTVTVVDDVGCSSSSQVNLDAPPAIVLNSSTISPTCFGDNNGAILIDTLLGGTGPFEFSIDGNFFQAISSYPQAIPFLDAGTYQLSIQDVNDCQTEQTITVNTPLEYQVDLGPDINLLLGDSTELFAAANFLADSIAWSSNPTINCLDCLEQYVQPFETTSYSIYMADTLGCTATDELTVFVEKPRSTFIPNVFSPNGDGINDVFFVNTSQEVLRVKTFRVFDRWGEIVFRVDNRAPNDPVHGWDGRLNGKVMNPAVFVYFIELEFIDGVSKQYSGDLTLMR
ncbi:MAG: gliding motility-associated C-terminal domain-containing protein, partial [Bacteroidota bacterium]